MENDSPEDKGMTAKKRSIARRFNDALSTQSSKTKVVDQRTGRRLQRYKNELKTGLTTGDKLLTALEVAQRINDLLDSGEKLTDLRNIARPLGFGEYEEETMVEVLQQMHSVYQFRPDAYRFVGIRNETLHAAGIIDVIPAKRGRKPKEK